MNNETQIMDAPNTEIFRLMDLARLYPETLRKPYPLLRLKCAIKLLTGRFPPDTALEACRNLVEET